jgi:hypothetical protein
MHFFCYINCMMYFSFYDNENNSKWNGCHLSYSPHDETAKILLVNISCKPRFELS